MPNIPKRVEERITKQFPRYQKVLASAKDRDVNEADTVTIVAAMLEDIFGFDKFTEITRETAIRGTYCDLAVQVDGKIRMLIEAKAVGLSLRDNHLRQAVNYGAHHGIPWIALTNGLRWEIYKIRFEKPIDYDEVLTLEMLDLSSRKPGDREHLYLLSREGLAKAAIEEHHAHVQTINKFVIGATLQQEPVLSVVRRELKRLAPKSRVTPEEISTLIREVLKREVIEGEAAIQAMRKVQRAKPKPKSEPALRTQADGTSSTPLA